MGVASVIQLCVFEKFQEFVIGADFHALAQGRNDPVDDAGNSGRPVIFQHAQAFISFLNVEISQIFIANNRVADAHVPLVRLTQRHPFRRKFRLAVQQREKARRKCGNSSGAFHADNSFNGDFQGADILRPLGNAAAQYLIQHQRKRVLSLPLEHRALLLPKPERFQIFAFGLCHRHFDSSKNRIYSIKSYFFSGEKAMRKRIKKMQDFPSNQSESNKKSRKNRNAPGNPVTTNQCPLAIPSGGIAWRHCAGSHDVFLRT